MGQAVVFFDGVCGLCDRFVSWLIVRDRRKTLTFAPLQGTTAAAAGLAPDKSIVFMDGGVFYRKSSATLRILTRMGGVWKAFAVFYILPRPLRDALYDYIADHRYLWFGKKDSCRRPAPHEASRFLP